MTIHPNSLAAKVAAQNEANKIALDSYYKAIEPLKLLIGEKILKVDLTLLEKVKKLLPELTNTNECRAYYNTGAGYSLRISVSVNKCFASRDCQIAEYMEATAYLCDLRGSILIKLYEPPQLRLDFTENEILAARAELKVAKEKVSSLQSKLYGFGE
jgi:hypothetical protein